MGGATVPTPKHGGEASQKPAQKASGGGVCGITKEARRRHEGIKKERAIPVHDAVDVALKGKATQSSLYQNYPANLAIDGNRASILSSGSCAHTNAEYNPWWMVDLLAVHNISTVIITNRADCCTQRLTGGEIHIGNSLVNNGNNNPRCVVISTIAPGGSANYTCNMRGRYVSVILPNTFQYLTICELEVYGVSVPVIKRGFLKLKIKSSDDLNNPTMKDNILQKAQ
ncbi:fucolectin-like [Clarias gariepinus]